MLWYAFVDSIVQATVRVTLGDALAVRTGHHAAGAHATLRGEVEVGLPGQYAGRIRARSVQQHPPLTKRRLLS